MHGGAVQVQVQRAAGANLNVAGQGAAVDAHVGRTAIRQFQHVAITTLQGGAVIDIDLDHARRLHHNSRAALANHSRLVERKGRRVRCSRVPIDFNTIGGASDAALIRVQVPINGQQALLAAYDLTVIQSQYAGAIQDNALGGALDQGIENIGRRPLGTLAPHDQSDRTVTGNMRITDARITVIK